MASLRAGGKGPRRGDARPTAAAEQTPPLWGGGGPPWCGETFIAVWRQSGARRWHGAAWAALGNSACHSGADAFLRRAGCVRWRRGRPAGGHDARLVRPPHGRRGPQLAQLPMQRPTRSARRTGPAPLPSRGPSERAGVARARGCARGAPGPRHILGSLGRGSRRGAAPCRRPSPRRSAASPRPKHRVCVGRHSGSAAHRGGPRRPRGGVGASGGFGISRPRALLAPLLKRELEPDLSDVLLAQQRDLSRKGRAQHLDALLLAPRRHCHSRCSRRSCGFCSWTRSARGRRRCGGLSRARRPGAPAVGVAGGSRQSRAAIFPISTRDDHGGLGATYSEQDARAVARWAMERRRTRCQLGSGRLRRRQSHCTGAGGSRTALNSVLSSRIALPPIAHPSQPPYQRKPKSRNVGTLTGEM